MTVSSSSVTMRHLLAHKRRKGKIHYGGLTPVPKGEALRRVWRMLEAMSCPDISLKGGVTEKDFLGFTVVSTSLFPLKGEVSNRKGIFDEHHADI